MKGPYEKKWDKLLQEVTPTAEEHGVCAHNMAGSIASEQGWFKKMMEELERFGRPPQKERTDMTDMKTPEYEDIRKACCYLVTKGSSSPKSHLELFSDPEMQIRIWTGPADIDELIVFTTQWADYLKTQFSLEESAWLSRVQREKEGGKQ